MVLSDVVCALDALECKSSDKLFGVRKLLRNGDVKFSRVVFQNQVPNAQKMHYYPLQRQNDLTTCGGKQLFILKILKLKVRVHSR